MFTFERLESDNFDMFFFFFFASLSQIVASVIKRTTYSIGTENMSRVRLCFNEKQGLCCLEMMEFKDFPKANYFKIKE